MESNNLHTEKELFEKIAAGDQQAFTQAYDLFKARLFFYAKHFRLEEYKVEDIVADAFLALWKGRHQLQSDEHLQAPVKLTTVGRFKLTSAGRFKVTTVGRSKLTTR